MLNFLIMRKGHSLTQYIIFQINSQRIFDQQIKNILKLQRTPEICKVNYQIFLICYFISEKKIQLNQVKFNKLQKLPIKIILLKNMLIILEYQLLYLQTSNYFHYLLTKQQTMQNSFFEKQISTTSANINTFIGLNQDQMEDNEPDHRFHNIENFLFFPQKSKQAYLKSLVLISKTFRFDLNEFPQRNCKIDQNTALEPEISQMLKINLEEVISDKQPVEFLKSYGGFTRKVNKVVFLLIMRMRENQQEPSLESYQKKMQLRFLFLNELGKVIHVISKLDESTIWRLQKTLRKHFTKLQNLYVLDFSSRTLQQCHFIVQLFKSKKISRKIILISPLAKTIWEQIKKFISHSSLKLIPIKKPPRHYLNLNNCLILELEDEIYHDFDKQIQQAFRFQKIHDFIIENLYNYHKLEKLSHQTLFQNQWINNVFAWYFNIIESLGSEAPLDAFSITTLKSIDQKIAENFFQLISDCRPQQLDYNPAENCFIDLLEKSKKCLVCRISKPKYGCLKCSKRFKLDINLCIENCFKAFHKEPIKYLSKKTEGIDSNLARKKQTKNQNLKNVQSQRPIDGSKEQKDDRLDRQPENKKSCKCANFIFKYKKIKKTARKILSQSLPSVWASQIEGVKVYNFLEIQKIDIQQVSIPQIQGSNSDSSFQDQQLIDKISQELNSCREQQMF